MRLRLLPHVLGEVEEIADGIGAGDIRLSPALEDSEEKPTYRGE
jgi:hypothetical protein